MPDGVYFGGGAVGGLIVLIGFVKFLIGERTAQRTLKEQVAELHDHVDRLEQKIADIEGKYNEQRRLKHEAVNALTKCTLTLGLVQRLARDCTCNVLDPLEEIISRLVLDIPPLSPTDQGDLL